MSYRRYLLLYCLLGLILVTAACGGPSETANNPNAPINSGEPVDEPPGENDSGLFLPVPTDIEVALTTPETGNGTHPQFTWEEVDGAAFYMLFLFEEGGGAYWAWEGEGTEVILGGFIEPPPLDADGPILLEPMQWAVVVVSAGDEIIASSKLRPVAP